MKVKELGICDKVILTGVRSDVPDLLQAMDCFVFPSLYEGLPVTVIEAQAAGLHTICSNTITTEIQVTPLIEMCSLSDTPDKWANHILKYDNGYKRENMVQAICSTGAFL